MTMGGSGFKLVGPLRPGMFAPGVGGAGAPKAASTGVPGDVDASYAVAAALLKERFGQGLSTIRPGGVVHVGGTFDHIDKVLRAAGIPFQEALPPVGVLHEDEAIFKLEDGLTEEQLEAARVVFASCRENFPEVWAHRIAQFVERGGLLVATDWLLKHLIEKAFPGYIAFASSTGPNASFPITSHRQDLGIGFFEGQGAPVWFVEHASYLPYIIDPGKVMVIAESTPMREMYGNGVVMAAFQHGQGLVLYATSHIYAQHAVAGDERDQLSAADFAKATGASPATVDFATQAGSGATYTGAQAAVSTMSFVTQVVTGGSSVMGQKGGPQRSKAERGEVPRYELPWEPTSRTLRWDPETNQWRTGEAWPMTWDQESGFYTLSPPPENVWIIVGRGTQEEWDAKVNPEIRFVIDSIRAKSPGSQIVFIPLMETSGQRRLSRAHCLIRPTGNGGAYQITSLLGKVAILDDGDDPSKDIKLIAGGHQQASLSTHQRVRLASGDGEGGVSAIVFKVG